MPETLHYRPSDPYQWAQDAMDQMTEADKFGRHLAIKAVSYDADTGVGTAELRAVLPDEYRERIMPLVEQQRARNRIRAVFGG